MRSCRSTSLFGVLALALFLSGYVFARNHGEGNNNPNNSFQNKSPFFHDDFQRDTAMLASKPRRTTISDNKALSSFFGATTRDYFDDFDDNFMPRQPDLPDDYDKEGLAAGAEGGGGGDSRLPHCPIIYRYYGKRRSRTRASGAVPFILLGPNVDHWRTTGEHLAARGFSVVACERDPPEPDDDGSNEQLIEKTASNKIKSTSQQSTSNSEDPKRWTDEEWWEGEDEEAANMISNVLQASRWSKAILVACDSEAVLAIQASLRLAPEKIAGLVLCGDLKEIDLLLKQSHPDLVRNARRFALDAFLHRTLPCPFAIAWDGEMTAADKVAPPSEYDGSSPAECLDGNRCFILGGGIAPHRKQPETFAWILTRFVEDKVAPSIPMEEKIKLFRRVRKERKLGDQVSHVPHIPKSLQRLFSNRIFSTDFFSSGSFVVYGRIIASALLYGSVLKVAIYQYGNFLDGAVNLKTRYDVLRSLKGKIVEMISGFFLNWGYIPLLFSRASEAEPDPADFVPGNEADTVYNEHGDDAEDAATPEEVANLDDQAETNEKEEVEEGESTQEVESSEEVIHSEGDPADENEKEEDEERAQERRVYQPLFFIDRVVAFERSSTDEIQT